jgi:hypothetical protein
MPDPPFVERLSFININNTPIPIKLCAALILFSLNADHFLFENQPNSN